MAGFKDSITKAIGNSKLFNKTADFLADKQKKFKADKALEEAKQKLTALYNELGETTHNRKPLAPGRTSTVIRAEIDAQLIVVAECEALVNELSAPKPDVENKEFSEDSEAKVLDPTENKME